MPEKKRRQLQIETNGISVKDFDGEDYLSLTDMLRNKDGDFFISDWLRNRNTIEFLGVWESMYSLRFKDISMRVRLILLTSRYLELRQKSGEGIISLELRLVKTFEIPPVLANY